MATTVDPIETTQQPISDDQELAKVLAGINQEVDVPADVDVAADPIVQPVASDLTAPALTEPVTNPVVPAVVEPVIPDPIVSNPVVPAAPSGDLTSVKSEAINELRPLVDKLSLPAEEKFDTYLLLLRSTDDRALIGPAHEIAKQITDEARRAQALLDIIKEIDFLSQSQQ